MSVKGSSGDSDPAAEARWAAVVACDTAADGEFVYSVKTTGVYCRPSCRARSPRRENIAFHATPADAERAGFRPCRRCKPDQSTLAARHAEKIAYLCRVMEVAQQPPMLAELATMAGLSESHLRRLFKRTIGLTPRQYAAQVRAGRVREGLDLVGKSGATGTIGTVTEAIYGAGFSSSSRFYEKADEMLGMTPSEYRAGGASVGIMFAVGESSLGSILVAKSARGVCAILLGDDPDELARELQRRFPNAELLGGDAGFESVVANVVGFVEAPCVGLDLPLDIRGTAFQQRVWNALRDIPVGETVSYQEIARRIGSPTSTRAVAGACAANSIAVAIPCHRVVRTDGALSGYRWGVERKRMLLQREGACVPPVTS